MNNWKPHYYRAGAFSDGFDIAPSETTDLRKKIEPWLSAVFQAEHLSLLVGNGLTSAIAQAVGVKPISMEIVEYGLKYEDQVKEKAIEAAKTCGRSKPNIEDQIRVVTNLINGLEMVDSKVADLWRKGLNSKLMNFLRHILEVESSIKKVFEKDEKVGSEVQDLLTSFLLSFASRAASRERLNIFTTNYDRIIEYGCDITGLRVIDRFVGGLQPIFRSSRLNIDIHYNPPGIRGEPRYLEGVVKLTKLHGSIDWRYEEKFIKRHSIPLGAADRPSDVPENPFDSVMIYPNPAKDMETCEYPYSELFRDLAAFLCTPNSALVTYGYGFGDDHINRVIRDMLTVPSTHLVIISYDEASGRISSFCNTLGHESQISLLIGEHFGDLSTLVKNYLPKPAIDQITWRKAELIRRRSISYPDETTSDIKKTASEEGK